MLSLFDQGAFAPCPACFNLAAHVLARAGEVPTKCALQVIRPDGAETWSYARLEAAVRGCGSGLMALGLPPGARILMRLGNTPDFAVLFLAAIAVGLVPIPTSAQLTGPEISRMATMVSPALIVAAEGIALPTPLPCPVLSTTALAAMAALAPCDWAMGPPDRLAYIVFTSGTSGRPQAVAHAHRAIWARRMMYQGWYGLTGADRVLHAGAFNWTYTLGTGLLDPWSVGATALIPGDGITAAQLPQLMLQYEASLFAAVPGVYRQMLKQELPALPQLRHGLCAGEKLPEALRRQWQDATGTQLHEAFGMSECSTFISASPSHPAPEGTLGYPQPGRRVAVLGDDGPVARGTPGILAISRHDPGLFLGYLDDDTQSRFRGEWFLTNDTVSMAADAAISYLGRDDDMMNAGGYRVSPLEVETTLTAHPGISECAVTELEVKPGTFVIACFYIAAKAIDPDSLFAFSAARLARYKQPRMFLPVAALPRGSNGKLIRRALRDLAPKQEGA